jgi:hypothetical protein
MNLNYIKKNRLFNLGKVLFVNKNRDILTYPDISPDIQFEIGTMKFYNVKTGMESEEISNKFKGSKFQVAFRCGSITLPHTKANIAFEGIIPMFGEIGEVVPEMDLNLKSIEKSQLQFDELCHSLGVYGKGTEYEKRHKNCIFEACSAATNPGYTLEDMKPLAILMPIYFVMGIIS